MRRSLVTRLSQRATRDLDQDDRAIGHRHRRFGKLQTRGDFADPHAGLPEFMDAIVHEAQSVLRHNGVANASVDADPSMSRCVAA